MRISDWSSDVCSSDLHQGQDQALEGQALHPQRREEGDRSSGRRPVDRHHRRSALTMALKSYNPTSPAQRGLILVDKSSLWKGKPVKALTEGQRKTGGRNNKGHVTSRGSSGGPKQKYRFIPFKRAMMDKTTEKN